MLAILYLLTGLMWGTPLQVVSHLIQSAVRWTILLFLIYILLGFVPGPGGKHLRHIYASGLHLLWRLVRQLAHVGVKQGWRLFQSRKEPVKID